MIGSENNGMYMPVAPAYMSGCNNGFGGDWGEWIILFLIFGMFGNGGWGNGFGGGYGNMMLGYDFPWLLNGQNNINANTNNGFRDAMINDGINGIQNNITSSFGDVQTALCGGFASVNASINGAQNAIAQQMYANQIADMNQRFTDVIAQTNQMNNLASGLQNCCCENRAGLADLKYTVATENCADRAAVADGIRDVIAAQTASTQKILDQLCQDKIDAKNDEIARLRQEVAMKDLAASQTAQNAFIQAGFSNEVDQLYNRLNNCPVPTTPVYGRTPIFTCNGNYAGCGCGA
jgi:hypothetical protein